VPPPCTSPTDQEDAYFRKQDQELRQKLREELGQAAGDLKQAPRDLSLAGQASRSSGSSATSSRSSTSCPSCTSRGPTAPCRARSVRPCSRSSGTRVPRTSVAFALMESLLEERPPQNFLDESLSCSSWSPGTPAPSRRRADAFKVASASGGFMNVGNVSGEERRRSRRSPPASGPRPSRRSTASSAEPRGAGGAMPRILAPAIALSPPSPSRPPVTRVDTVSLAATNSRATGPAAIRRSELAASSGAPRPARPRLARLAVYQQAVGPRRRMPRPSSDLSLRAGQRRASPTMPRRRAREQRLAARGAPCSASPSFAMLRPPHAARHGKPPEDPRPASLLPVVAQRDLRRDPHAHRPHRVHAQRQRPHRPANGRGGFEPAPMEARPSSSPATASTSCSRTRSRSSRSTAAPTAATSPAATRRRSSSSGPRRSSRARAPSRCGPASPPRSAPRTSSAPTSTS
jgi:hypothetical protein